MKAWIDLLLSFASGLVLGLVLAFFRFKSRLGLYKEFIERRLAQINLHNPPKAPDLSEPSTQKDVSGCQPEPSEESKTIQNK